MSTSKPVGIVLREAHSLLQDPSKWTTEARARDLYGNPVHPAHPDAVRWCLEGAVGLCASSTGIIPFELLEILDRAALDVYGDVLKIEHVNFDTGEPEAPVSAYLGYASAFYINDVLGHEAILLVLEKAIESTLR